MKSLNTRPKLILASTSVYRARALRQLNVDFSPIDPELPETLVAHENAADRAIRLATAKAQAVLSDHLDAVVIGSDQVGVCQAQILGKPGSKSAAIEQLLFCRNHKATFFTAVAIYSKRRSLVKCISSELVFRDLSRAQIERYLDIEEAWDCAGSFKIESLGIALFTEVRSTDPSALIGLPLIATTSMLAEFGFSPFD